MSDSMHSTEPFRVFRANNSGSGTALKLGAKREVKPNQGQNGEVYYKDRLFLTLAKQMGGSVKDASFGWKEDGANITLQLGDADIGAVLAFLNGSLPLAKSIHQNPSGSTSYSFEPANEGKGVRVQINGDRNGVKTNLGITLGHGDVAIFREILVHYIRSKYNLMPQS